MMRSLSGGENISSLEIEGVLHQAVLLAAAVAAPDEKWGEVPCAVIEFKPGASATGEQLMAFARQHLAGFKIRRRVEFRELPETATGKIQKLILRDAAGTDFFRPPPSPSGQRRGRSKNPISARTGARR